MEQLTEGARAVLLTADADAKAAASRALAEAWRSGRIATTGVAGAPARPARPTVPALCPPREVPRRKITAAPAGRFALLHAVAHIELNAIDLAWDMVARFAEAGPPPRPFFDDWVSVADDEARHFQMLQERLGALGGHYGDLAAHDGLWQAAEETAHDLLARLAIVPMVLEARGLDVTPAMITKLTNAGDHDSAAVLAVIAREEIGHVAIGKRWFLWLCHERGETDPKATWQALVRRHFRGLVKPPFNELARTEAGLPPDYYEPLSERCLSE